MTKFADILASAQAKAAALETDIATAQAALDAATAAKGSIDAQITELTGLSGDASALVDSVLEELTSAS